MTSEPDDVTIELRADEVQMLRRLAEQLRARLRDRRSTDDPVVGRLFPAVVQHDDATDREARQLIHADLLRERLARLDEVLDLLGERGGARTITLSEDQPPLLMGVLNDLRLSLAVQTGLDRPPQERGELDADAQQAAALLGWLAWWQERILGAIDPDALRFYEEESDLSP